jgi:hypothetical protein
MPNYRFNPLPLFDHHVVMCFIVKISLKTVSRAYYAIAHALRAELIKPPQPAQICAYLLDKRVCCQRLILAWCR